MIDPTASSTAGQLGPIGRLGRYTATHFRTIAFSWVVLSIALGALAPKVERALSGAGWEASGSESVNVRGLLDRHFEGMSSSALQVVIYSPKATISDPAFQDTVSRVQVLLGTDKRVSKVVPPQPGQSISDDGHTAVVQAGAASDPNQMVRVADDLKPELTGLGDDEIDVNLTGATGMWSDFNQANKTAMLKSELISWPVTLAILVLAFGSLVAASLPLMLTILGLVSAAGSLYLGTQSLDISIWAMNFALMFALALGIDYALFIVMRFRGAMFGANLSPEEAVAEALDTAGKAVMFSGLTVLISLSAVLLVPSPAFRSMALGIMLSVTFILAASLTLLPAVLAKLGPKVEKFSLPWVHSGEHRSPRFARWAERLWRRPLPYGAAALVVLVVLSVPVLDLKTGMPSIKVVPEGDASRQGYDQVQSAFGAGAPGVLQVVAPADETEVVAKEIKNDPAIVRVASPQSGGNGLVLINAVPGDGPSDGTVGQAINRLRSNLPTGALVGGAVAENHDLEVALAGKTIPVIGVVLTLGFLLLLVALQAPILAAAGVLTNLLATGAAFGISQLIFQRGNLADLLGFEPQGFLDAWGPVFFFAMIFAISMDYTVFLLSSAKEHWDRGEGAKGAMIGGLAHSGRVIFAAAAVMVAVFFTFALSGPLPPKEMGVILGVAVLLDATLVRLLLIPVVLRLLGETAWWLPRPLARFLPKVGFGHR